jgi:hypothetical protein
VRRRSSPISTASGRAAKRATAKRCC